MGESSDQGTKKDIVGNIQKEDDNKGVHQQRKIIIEAFYS